MDIAPLTATEMPEVVAFFPRMGLEIPPENIRQFAWPRRPAPGFENVTLGLRDGGRLIGIIGYLDLPLRVGGRTGTGRWPINLHLLAEYRGRGLGQRLMEATREGAALRLVIGGNQNSTPVLGKTGWMRIGHLCTFQWTVSPCAVEQLPDRIAWDGPAGSIEALRMEEPDGPTPWIDGAPEEEHGVPRDTRYLRYAFGGELASYHRLYRVAVGGAVAGFFALALRSDRPPRRTVEILDVDAIPGLEAQVLEAAWRTAAVAGDVVRTHLSARRLLAAARTLPGDRIEAEGLPIWLSADEALDPRLQDPGSWRITHGDHDRYRILPVSQIWS